jgi:hypothetical protein
LAVAEAAAGVAEGLTLRVMQADRDAAGQHAAAVEGADLEAHSGRREDAFGGQESRVRVER